MMKVSVSPKIKLENNKSLLKISFKMLVQPIIFHENIFVKNNDFTKKMF